MERCPESRRPPPSSCHLKPPASISPCPVRTDCARSPTADELPSLTDFGLIDGLLVGDLDSPWLPPSVTMLALAAVGLTRLPGVLAHLPRLQR